MGNATRHISPAPARTAAPQGKLGVLSALGAVLLGVALALPAAGSGAQSIDDLNSKIDRRP